MSTYHLTPGLYFIGDPSCLVINEEDWMKVINASDSFTTYHQIIFSNGSSICAAPTLSKEEVLVNHQHIKGARQVLIENGLLGIATINPKDLMDKNYLKFLNSKGMIIAYEKEFKVHFEESNSRLEYIFGELSFSLNKEMDKEHHEEEKE